MDVSKNQVKSKYYRNYAINSFKLKFNSYVNYELNPLNVI
jgi:hypothetical protein